MMPKDKQLTDLIESIKSWWEVHKDDSIVNGDGDEIYLYFPYEPEFVRKAEEIAGDWEQEKKDI
jgi:hypothetical protein